MIDFKAAIGMGPMSDTRIVGIFVIAAVVANGGVCYTITAYFLGFMIDQKKGGRRRRREALLEGSLNLLCQENVQ